MKNRKTTVCSHCGLPCRSLQRHLNRHHPYQPGNNSTTQQSELPPPSLPPPRPELPPTAPPPPRPATPTTTPLRAPSPPKPATPQLPSSPLSSPVTPTYVTVSSPEDDEWRSGYTSPPIVSLSPFSSAAVAAQAAKKRRFRVDRATQVDGPAHPAIRTVRRLHVRASRPRLVTVERDGSVRSSLSQEVRTFAQHVPDAEPRRLCDCSRCIRHAVDLLRLSLPVERNGIPSIEFTRLPGMNLARAPESDIRALAKSFDDVPDQRVVACGCGPCTAHRNLIQAWLQAQDFEDTSPRSGKLSRPRHK